MKRRTGLLGMLLSLFGCGQPADAERPAAAVPAPAPAAPAPPTRPDPRLATYDSDGYELDDGERMHAAAPATFTIPSSERRRGLTPGDIVKLVFRMEQEGTDILSVERMWVKVTEARDGAYVGVLDNDPVGRVRTKAGDRVEFEARHVIDVHER